MKKFLIISILLLISFVFLSGCNKKTLNDDDLTSIAKSLNISGYDTEYKKQMIKDTQDDVLTYYENNPDRDITFSSEDELKFKSVQKMVSNGKFPNALEELAYFKEKYARKPSVIMLGAAISCSMGKYDDGIEKLQEILDYPATMKGLAVCYFGAKNYFKAEFYINRALQITPNDVVLEMMKERIPK